MALQGTLAEGSNLASATPSTHRNDRGLAPNHREILDSNIEYTYTYHLILGTLQEIRGWVYSRSYRPGADFRFCGDRQHWHYLQATDAGWPVDGWVRVSLASNDPTLVSPFCAYYATNIPRLYIRAAYRIAKPAGRATGQVFWQTANDTAFSEAQSLRFPVVADEQFRTYELNLSASNNYAGLITRLRFDPAISGQTGDYADIPWISSSPVGTNETSRIALTAAQASETIMIAFSTLKPACVCQEGRQFLYNLEARTNLISDSWRGVPG